MTQFIHDNIGDLLKGSLGIGFSLGAAVVSSLSDVEQWLRIGSLVVGITVGLVTLWSILRKNKAMDKAVREEARKFAEETIRGDHKQ